MNLQHSFEPRDRLRMFVLFRHSKPLLKIRCKIHFLFKINVFIDERKFNTRQPVKCTYVHSFGLIYNVFTIYICFYHCVFLFETAGLRLQKVQMLRNVHLIQWHPISQVPTCLLRKKEQNILFEQTKIRISILYIYYFSFNLTTSVCLFLMTFG